MSALPLRVLVLSFDILSQHILGANEEFGRVHTPGRAKRVLNTNTCTVTCSIPVLNTTREKRARGYAYEPQKWFRRDPPPALQRQEQYPQDDSYTADAEPDAHGGGDFMEDSDGLECLEA